jgi:hypothetical protein
MKKPKNSPTPQQVLEFAAYIAAYQDLLNLRDWRIEPSSKAAPKGSLAAMSISSEDRLATWHLGNDWGNHPITSQSLRETAAHEVLHVFLRPLIEAAASRDSQATAEAEHSIVVLLEKALTQP